jgi:hypothetical protein
MVITERHIYLTVFIIAFGIGVYVYKYHKALWLFVVVMGLGLLTEFIVELNKSFQFTTEEFIYNVYIPMEYLLYASFFYFINESVRMRKAILLSYPVYIIIVILFSKFSYFETNLSSLVYNLGGVLVITWSIWTLFVVKPEKGIKFRNLPLLWICAGLIIFHSGIIPFNLMHNYLKPTNTDLFVVLSNIIQKGFNIFLYTMFIIGFICSHRMKI